jgi:hypothetical protein
VEEHRHYPDINRISVLAAMILLAYSMARFIDIPERSIAIKLPGIFLSFSINFQTIVAVLVAGLAAAGMNWLLRGHPEVHDQPTYQHWLVPALTALVIGAPLARLASGPEWWIVFGMGGGLLMLVFVAEYIVADTGDIRHPHASAGLTALSFALFLILAIAVRAAGLRLYLALPALVPAVALVSLRTLYLRLGGHWKIGWGAVIAIIIGQLAAGLHYWPMSPIAYGLALVGPAYALTSFASGYEEGRPVVTWLVEPLVMLTAIWGMALLIG